MSEDKQIPIDEARTLLIECYNDIISVLKNYIDTSEENYKLIALWIVGTYFHAEFNTFPYLFFNAMRGSGKTRALKLISALGANGDGSVQNNLTEAVLFRIPKGTTTCIDEVEQINNKEKQTLRELLNSAYKKGMKVKRMRKVRVNNQEIQQAEEFEPYFPIAMANIYGVEEVLADRSIVLVLEKSNNPAIVKMIEDFERNYTILGVKRTLSAISCSLCSVVSEKNIERGWNQYISQKYNYIYTLTTPTTLTTLNTPLLLGQINDGKGEALINDKGNVIEGNAYSKLKTLEQEEIFEKIDNLGIGGRNLELIFPLLIVSQLLGQEVFEEFLNISSRFVQTKRDDEYTTSKDVSLFEFIAQFNSAEFISVKELSQRFRSFLGESDEEDKWLNDKWMGRALKRLNLIIDKRRMNTGMFVTLNQSKAKEKLKIFKIETK